MDRRRLARFLFNLVGSAALAAAITGGCSATQSDDTIGPSGTSAGQGGAAQGGAGGSPSVGGEGGIILDRDAGPDVEPDVYMDPCNSKCGVKELCDADHLGLDDDCNGFVDEDCPCTAGQAHFCFKGEPSYHGSPGCFDGTEKCTENGQWGPCLGGVHATEECYANNMNNCHAISSPPFVVANLKDGTGNFSVNAVAGTEVWTVACPVGVDPCPAVGGANPPDDFQPLQSGEYTVTYTKGLSGGGTDSCTYPLLIGAPGLRVELEWEHDLGGLGVDLDLHVHQPNTTTPWSVIGASQDCTWSSCVVDDFNPPSPASPNWFSDVAVPPDPVNWFLDPVMQKNTCYYAPRGVGAQWQALGKGCHNPRLDLDNINCDPTVLDPDDDNFCAPENVNIDFPPLDQWTRVGVHYFSSHSVLYDVHPKIKIYCDGALSAELGPTGFYDPSSPVTFAPSDGAAIGGNRFWLVADVIFQKDRCHQGCTVQPIYSDPNSKTPLLTNETALEASFGPNYPPIP